MALAAPVSRATNQINITGQTSITATVGATGVAQNSLLVVTLGFGNTASPTLAVADSKGNTYQLDKSQHDATNGTNAVIYSALAATALVQNDTVTVTATVTTINFPIMDVYEVTGAATTSWLDGTPAGATGTSTSPSSGNVTTSNADDLIMGVMFFSGGATTLTAGSNLTVLVNRQPGTKSYATEYRIVSATGSYPANGTISNDSWSAAAAAYKQAAAATSVYQPGFRYGFT